MVVVVGFGCCGVFVFFFPAVAVEEVRWEVTDSLYPLRTEALLDQRSWWCPARRAEEEEVEPWWLVLLLLLLAGPSTRMLGMVTESGDEAAEEVVSSKMVVGVSGTMAAAEPAGPEGASWYCRLLMLEFDRGSDRFEDNLNGFWGGEMDWKVVWLGRGVPRSGRICVQPSRKRSQSSQQACTADPRSSSSAAVPSRVLWRRLNSISANDQHARRRASVSCGKDVRCFISRWHIVM